MKWFAVICSALHRTYDFLCAILYKYFIHVYSLRFPIPIIFCFKSSGCKLNCFLIVFIRQDIFLYYLLIADFIPVNFECALLNLVVIFKML